VACSRDPDMADTEVVGTLTQLRSIPDDFFSVFRRHLRRPHHSLHGRCLGQLYRPSTRPYAGFGELEYPMHDRTITVTQCGRIGGSFWDVSDRGLTVKRGGACGRSFFIAR
jgi:hypothetical protein